MPEKPTSKHTFTRQDIINACLPPSDNPATASRLRRIERDFADGFEFSANIHRAVSFFGSAILEPNDPYYKDAQALAGRLASEASFTVVTGGGPGIMEAANRGAYEAGGKSIGLTIELRDHQEDNRYVSAREQFHYFFARKVALAFTSRIYIFYPGGFGTLNEFYELVMLVQTKKIHPLPIICVGSDYWQPIYDFMQTDMITKFKVLHKKDLQYFQIIDSHDEIIKIAQQANHRR